MERIKWSELIKIILKGKGKVGPWKGESRRAWSKESNREPMLKTPTNKSSTMVIEEEQPWLLITGKGGFPNKEKRNEGIWCIYYNKPHHTRENC